LEFLFFVIVIYLSFGFLAIVIYLLFVFRILSLKQYLKYQ